MSSIRTRATNKLLNKIGAVQPSKNVQFDIAFAGFEKTIQGILDLDTALRGFIVSLKGFHTSAAVLMGAIEDVAATQENSEDMKRFTGDIRSIFHLLDVSMLQETVKNFESRVLKPSHGWLSRAQHVKHQVSVFQEEKLVFDHYTRKVISMREARDKRSATGKSEKAKDVDKLVRNEQKLVAATNSYNKISDSTIKNLRDFVNCREDTLSPLLHRVLEFRLKYAQQTHDASKKIQPLLKNDSVLDNFLKQLESYVSNFTGIDGHEEEGTDASTTKRPVHDSEPAEPVVQSLSFESFVGEAPPIIPTESATPPPPPVDDFMSINPSSQPSSWTAFDRPVSPSTSSSSPTGSPMNPFNFGQTERPASTPVGFGSISVAPVKPLTQMSPSSSSYSPWDDKPELIKPPTINTSLNPGMNAMTGSPTSFNQFNTMPSSPSNGLSLWGASNAFDENQGSQMSGMQMKMQTLQMSSSPTHQQFQQPQQQNMFQSQQPMSGATGNMGSSNMFDFSNFNQ